MLVPAEGSWSAISESGTYAWGAAGGGVDGVKSGPSVLVLVLAGDARVLVTEPDGVAGVPGDAAAVGRFAAPHRPRRRVGMISYVLLRVPRGPAGRTRLQEKTMDSRLNPYLNFNGNARQALEFYASVFGGKLSLNTFAQFGAEDSPDAERIMHGMLETDAGYTIMAADIASDMEHHPMAGFSVSLSGDDAGALRGYWEKLSAGGTTTMPMQKQVWGDEFGMCVDKFGVSWLVNITQPQA
jgi:PhnB protein